MVTPMRSTSRRTWHAGGELDAGGDEGGTRVEQNDRRELEDDEVGGGWLAVRSALGGEVGVELVEEGVRDANGSSFGHSAMRPLDEQPTTLGSSLRNEVCRDAVEVNTGVIVDETLALIWCHPLDLGGAVNLNGVHRR